MHFISLGFHSVQWQFQRSFQPAKTLILVKTLHTWNISICINIKFKYIEYWNISIQNRLYETHIGWISVTCYMEIILVTCYWNFSRLGFITHVHTCQSEKSLNEICHLIYTTEEECSLASKIPGRWYEHFIPKKKAVHSDTLKPVCVCLVGDCFFLSEFCHMRKFTLIS